MILIPIPATLVDDFEDENEDDFEDENEDEVRELNPGRAEDRNRPERLKMLF